MIRTLVAGLLAAALPMVVQAQSTCQQIGSQVFCNDAAGNSYSANRIGNQTFYNYNNPPQAQRQGLPSSSQRIGNMRFYDNGVTQQHMGNMDFFSNGVTKQHIGDMDFYSDGTTCQNMGGTRFCN